MKITIIYEDNHLLVVEKPVNIPVQENESGDMDLLTLLKEDIKVRYNKPGNVYLGLVHRLDRPVGGAMVFAKTSKAASRLSDTLRKHEMKREYIAVLRGVPEQNEGRLENYLWKDGAKNKVHVVSAKDKRGKKAILDYEMLQQNGNSALVKVALLTGRSHQIRVQFAHLGCPLFGDQKYGQKVNRVGEQIALWSQKIEFPHPTTKEWLSFECPAPNTAPWLNFKK